MFAVRLPESFPDLESALSEQTPRVQQFGFDIVHTVRVLHPGPIEYIVREPAAGLHQEADYVLEAVHGAGAAQDGGAGVVTGVEVAAVGEQEPEDLPAVLPGGPLHAVELLLAQVPGPQTPEVAVLVTHPEQEPGLLTHHYRLIISIFLLIAGVIPFVKFPLSPFFSL